MKLLQRALAVALSLTLCACGGNVSPPTPATATSAGKLPAVALPRTDVPGIANFAQVSDTLYRGAQPTRIGFLELRRMGVKTVVSFRAFHSDSTLMMNTGMKLLTLPEIAGRPQTADLLKFLKIVSDPAHQPVFVHCELGADRTGCAVAVYRIMEQNWSPDDAVAELPTFGYHPIFTEIKSYLNEFDRAGVLTKLAATKSPELTTP